MLYRLVRLDGNSEAWKYLEVYWLITDIKVARL